MTARASLLAIAGALHGPLRRLVSKKSVVRQVPPLEAAASLAPAQYPTPHVLAPGAPWPSPCPSPAKRLLSRYSSCPVYSMLCPYGSSKVPVYSGSPREESTSPHGYFHHGAPREERTLGVGILHRGYSGRPLFPSPEDRPRASQRSRSRPVHSQQRTRLFGALCHIGAPRFFSA